MHPLDNAGPTRPFDADLGRLPHDMSQDFNNINAFQQEQTRNPMMFEPAINWQAMGYAGIAR